MSNLTTTYLRSIARRLSLVLTVALVVLAYGPATIQPFTTATAAEFKLDPTANDFDLTGNALVNNSDVMEVVLAWTTLRETGTPCGALPQPELDVTGDGCLDIADVQRVAAWIGTLTQPIAERSSGGPTFQGEVAALAPLAERTTVPSAAGSPFVVNSTADDADAAPSDGVCATAAGVCTLRAAITEANLQSGADTISFNIPGAGPHTITLTSALPTLSDTTGGTTIDGYTQPGSAPNTAAATSNAVLTIQLVGPAPTTWIDALKVTSAGNVIRGLAMYRFQRNIWLSGPGAHDNRITGSFLGLDAAGNGWATASQAGSRGVLINLGAHHNQIGGTALAERVVVSGNANDGVALNNEGTEHNRFSNLLVGLSPDGSRRVQNWADGFDLNFSAVSNQIGGTAAGERNVISGNNDDGVEIAHDPTTAFNQVLGNYIGTDVSGNGAIRSVHRNVKHGVTLEDGVAHNTIAHNVLANNSLGGIQIYGTGNVNNNIHDNLIGVGVDGALIPSGDYGILIRFNASEQIVGPNNVITNHGTGIIVRDNPSKYNTISQNAIYNNRALGIDLDPTGVNPNDGNNGAGPNNRLDFPVITSATPTQVSGTAPANTTIEIFIATEGADRYGEGKTLIGSGVASGSGTFTVDVSGVFSGQYITSTASDSQGNTSEFSLNVPVSGTAFGPTTARLEAEDYNDGGPGVGFSDTTPGNNGGVYRGEDVDIQTCSDGSPCYNVAWITAGEWLAYDFNLNFTGNYQFTLRVATNSAGKTLRLEIDGVDVTGTMTLPNTGGYQSWANVSTGVIPLAGGLHKLRLVSLSGDYNLNYVDINSVSTPPPQITELTPSCSANQTQLCVNLTVNNPQAGETITLRLVNAHTGAAIGVPDLVVTLNDGQTSYTDCFPLPAGYGGAALKVVVVDTSFDPAGSVTLSDPLNCRVRLPGRIQAEDFTLGGEGIGYHDTTAGNTGGAYRSSDVDIETTTDSGGGFTVGWITAGEWLEYDVYVPTGGSFETQLRVATTYNSGTVKILIDGNQVGNTLNIPSTGGWQSWLDLPGGVINLTAGNHQLRILSDTGGFNLNYIAFEESSVPTRIQLPGRIQAEDFKPGGEGVGYHDTTAGNAGGAYRASDVDIEATSDAGGGFNVGWTDADEWLGYDVTVAATNDYLFAFRVASTYAGKTVTVEVDGTPAGSPVTIPNSGGWQSWTTVTSGPITLSAGDHEIRIVTDTGGFNLNYIDVSVAPAPSPTITAITPNCNANQTQLCVSLTVNNPADGETITLRLVNAHTGASVGVADRVIALNAGQTSYSDCFPLPAGYSGAALKVIVVTASFDLGGSVSESAPLNCRVRLPGRIQAEDFTLGGAGVGYHDTTGGNTGGAYRSSDVDIEPTSDSGGGFNVGWITAGEWLAYDVYVPTGGSFVATLRLATRDSGLTVRVLVDGVDVTGALTVPRTGGWQTWANQTTGTINLTAGNHQIRVITDTGGFNLNYIDVSSS